MYSLQNTTNSHNKTKIVFEDIKSTNTTISVPPCRTDFELHEIPNFLDGLILISRNLEDLSDIPSLYKVTKEINHTYSHCQEFRSQVSEHLIQSGFPALLARLIRRINNVGVFRNDATWFTSFYLYNTAWNYTEMSQEFATSFAVTGISHLLCLNIGHKPYLDNIASKNVYFLIKASLTILHNMVKIPGNRDMGQYEVGRNALFDIQRMENEESIKCAATLCLAHTIKENELDMFTSDKQDLLQLLTNCMQSAYYSTRRKYHGFTFVEILQAFTAFGVMEPVQTRLANAEIQKVIKPAKVPSTTYNMPPTMSVLKFLVKLTETYFQPHPSEVTQQEANSAIRLIYHLVFNSDLRHDVHMIETMHHILDLSRYPTILERKDKALSRVLENLIWQSNNTPTAPLTFEPHPTPDPSYCGPIVISYAPINSPAVTYFVNQLQAAGLPVWNDTDNEVINSQSAQDLGLSGLASLVTDQKSWFKCLNQATVMIACLSDAYRLCPGCKTELLYFIQANSKENPKVIIYIRIPPKFTVNGWLKTLPNMDIILDFTNKRTFILTLQHLVAMAGKPYGITVADQPLDPLSFEDSGEVRDGYISIGDLHAMKSSSIFLTSGESGHSEKSVISHTADDMISKGSPRLVKSSSSNSLTPLHSSATDGPTQYKHGDYEQVQTLPSASVSTLMENNEQPVAIKSGEKSVQIVLKNSPAEQLARKEDEQDKTSDGNQKTVVPTVIIGDGGRNVFENDPDRKKLEEFTTDHVEILENGSSVLIVTTIDEKMQNQSISHRALKSEPFHNKHGRNSKPNDTQLRTEQGQLSFEQNKVTSTTWALAEEPSKRSNTTLQNPTIKTCTLSNSQVEPKDNEMKQTGSRQKAQDSNKTVSTTVGVQANDSKPLNNTVDSSVQAYTMIDDVATIPSLPSSFGTFAEMGKLPMLSPNMSGRAPKNFISHEDIVLPEVREWTREQVDDWFQRKDLTQMAQRLCGPKDGVVLAQLVFLRHWAPEYFAKSLRCELGLDFVDGLRLVDAMEELIVKPK